LDSTELIQRSINYIDEHISDKIEAEELAEISGFSKYHFYRLFSNYLGMSVMEYITFRRLQFSCSNLRDGDKIIDIAMQFGFETHAGYTKAFKKHFGYSPKYYRIHAPVGIPHKINLMNLKQNHLSGIVAEPKIITKESIKIVGYKLDTTLKDKAHTKDVPAFWDNCNIEGLEANLYKTQKIVEHGEYGICINTGEEVEKFSYILGVEVQTFDQVEEPMYTYVVPSAEYAVFTTPLVKEEEFVTSIQGTWNYILQEWFPTSGYEVDDTKPDFEFYDERCHGWDHEKLQMEIYIPVKVRK
jgi:AraC family transcriptional regulator